MERMTREQIIRQLKVGCIVGIRTKRSMANDAAVKEKYKSCTTNTIARVNAIRTYIYDKQDESLPEIGGVWIKCAISDEWIAFENLSYVSVDGRVYQKVDDDWKEIVNENPEVM